MKTEEAVKLVKEVTGMSLPWDDAHYEALQMAIKALEQSTIKAERKNGKWVRISPAKIYECSECGTNVMTDDIDCYKFCHGCGAEMETEHGTV